MAKSLADIVRSNNLNAAKTTQNRLGPDDFIEYAGSNTDGLYVVGYKGDSPVKIKVRSNSCCDGIDLGGDNNGPISDETLKQGQTFNSFQALYESRDTLEFNTLYNVNDKGTSEQYICVLSSDGNSRNIIQISGGMNVILSDKEVSDCPLDLSTGVVDYPLPELVKGDYFFKGHTELHTFISDTHSLESGIEMFWNTGLRTFRGQLSSLTAGDRMFGKGVKLDYYSILSIVDSVSQVDGAKIDIGYDTSEVSSEDIDEFTAELNGKGWAVTWYADGEN